MNVSLNTISHYALPFLRENTESSWKSTIIIMIALAAIALFVCANITALLIVNFEAEEEARREKEEEKRQNFLNILLS